VKIVEDESKGLVVTEIPKSSPLHNHMPVGAIIQSINGHKYTKLRQLRRIRGQMDIEFQISVPSER
jgi:S1-C subfamily serine protease